MRNCKPTDTLVAKGKNLNIKKCPKTSKEKDKMNWIPHANAIETLMYVMTCTQPDICYAVCLVSQFQSNPGLDHQKAVKRILRYLRRISDNVLCYLGTNLHLVGYSDADLTGDLDKDWTSGYASCLMMAPYHKVARSRPVLLYPHWKRSSWHALQQLKSLFG